MSESSTFSILKQDVNWVAELNKVLESQGQSLESAMKNSRELEIIPGWTFEDNHTSRQQGWYISMLTYEIMNLRPFWNAAPASERVAKMASEGDPFCQRAIDAVVLNKLTK